MTVTYNIDDRFCECGHMWIRVNFSNLFSDYYYCEHCDKIFTPTVEEKTKEWFKENHLLERREQLIDYANTIRARAKVTNEDLKKLGYI